jgi:hypothetical protein
MALIIKQFLLDIIKNFKNLKDYRLVSFEVVADY